MMCGNNQKDGAELKTEYAYPSPFSTRISNSACSSIPSVPPFPFCAFFASPNALTEGSIVCKHRQKGLE